MTPSNNLDKNQNMRLNSTQFTSKLGYMHSSSTDHKHSMLRGNKKFIKAPIQNRGINPGGLMTQ